MILPIVAGAIILGIYCPFIFEKIKFFGDLFINLLKLFALPLICSALVVALGNLKGSLSRLKSMATKMVGYMLVSEFMAVLIALILFNILQPGVGGNSNLILSREAQLGLNQHDFRFGNFILSIFPDNIFYSLTHFELLPVVIFSVLFGLAAALVGDAAKPFLQLASSIRDISSKCLSGVMALAPVGIFVLVGYGVAQSHLSGSLQANFIALLRFVAVLFLGLFLHGLWQLILASIASKQKIFDILRQSLPVFYMAFGTSSSIATIPVSMHALERLKANPFATRLMLPLCASINLGGMIMYEMAAVFFFSQMLGLDLSLIQQILLAVACIVGSMAGGGIPETSMVTLALVFKIVNIPLSAISVLLPLDRIIDRARTVVNIFGNMCGVIVVSQLITEPKEQEEVLNVELIK